MAKPQRSIPYLVEGAIGTAKWLGGGDQKAKKIKWQFYNEQSFLKTTMHLRGYAILTVINSNSTK